MLFKFIVLTCLAFPMPVWALTLDEVVSAVTATHPAILQSQRVTEKIAAMKRAEVWPENPRVGVMFEESPVMDFGLGNANMTNYTVSQEIPNPLSLKYKSAAFEQEKIASRHMTTSVTREKVFEAKKIFFELVASQNARAAKIKLVGYYDQIISSLDKSYQSDMSQGAGGMPSPSQMIGTSWGDVLMAKMKKAEVQAELFDLNHAVNNLTAKLNLVMGRPATQGLGKIVMPRLKSLKLSNAALEAKVEHVNSDLMAADAMVAKSKNEIALTRSDLVPDVMADFAYNRRQNMDNAYSVGFSMSVPLWVNKNASAIKASKSAYLESQYKKQSLTLDLKQQLYFLSEHAREHFKIINTYRGEILPLAESAVNTALAEHQASATTAISVLQKIVSYHEAVGMYWELWSDYNMEFAMLENLIGEDL